MSLNFGQSLFPPRGERIVSYNYSDIAAGTGMSIFYGTKMTESDATITYKLVETTQMSGDSNFTSRSNYTHSNNPAVTVDFDTSVFNIPRVIHGTPYASIPVVAWVSSGTGTDTRIQVQNIKLIQVHSDDSTTDITTAYTFAEVAEAASGPAMMKDTHVVLFEKISNVIIKKGEKIRLTMDLYTSASNDGLIFHDPSNTTYTFTTPYIKYTTRLTVGIPFKIDV